MCLKFPSLDILVSLKLLTNPIKGISSYTITSIAQTRWNKLSQKVTNLAKQIACITLSMPCQSNRQKPIGSQKPFIDANHSQKAMLIASKRNTYIIPISTRLKSQLLTKTKA